MALLDYCYTRLKIALPSSTYRRNKSSLNLSIINCSENHLTAVGLGQGYNFDMGRSITALEMCTLYIHCKNTCTCAQELAWLLLVNTTNL